MSHDFAKQRAARANRSARSGPPPWLWLASGVVIGTLISFLVYLATLAPHPPQSLPPAGGPDARQDPSPASVATKPEPAKKPAATPESRPQFDFYDILRNSDGAAQSAPAATQAQDQTTPSAPTQAATTSAAPTRAQGTAGTAPAPHTASSASAPVEVPEPRQPPAALDGAAAPAPTATATPAAKPPETARPAGLAMQAGAFSRRPDADRRRGEIMLLGYEARIEPVKTPDGQIRYRVTVGPFKDAQALANARRALHDIGIDTM